MKEKVLKIIRFLLPFIAAAAVILVDYKVADSGKQKETKLPYFIYFMIVFIAAYSLFVIAGIFIKKIRHAVHYKAPFITGVALFLGILNYIFTKTTMLPTLYFPSLDRIIAVLVEKREFLAQNVLESLKLLLEGFAWGGIVGFLSGIALGYSKTFAYWVNPIVKIVGPIPTTAWIPLALSSFPTTRGANIFLIAYAVWFPVTLMTSSGILNTKNVYFEVSKTLGASTFFQIVKIAIPSAMPNIFMGIFYGTCSSFLTLMTVEMNGSSSGIGWYISWQKSVMLYDGVYAGLILIALLCTFILTVLFKVRDRILIWQKGVIKW